MTHRLRGLFVLLFVSLASALPPSVEAADLSFPTWASMNIGTADVFLPWDRFNFPSTPLGAVVLAPPRFGTLTVEPEGLRYRPDPEMWTIGGDSFRFYPMSFTPLGSSPILRTVIVTANDYVGTPLTDFEGSEAPGWTVDGASSLISFRPEAAMRGNMGLRVEGSALDQVMLTRWDLSHGGGQQGTNMGTTFKPPGGGTLPPPTGFPMPWEPVNLYTGTGFGSEVRVELGQHGDEYKIRAVAATGEATPWKVLTAAPHRFALMVGHPYEGLELGAHFYVDGELVGALAPGLISNPEPQWRYEVGVSSAAVGPRPTIDFDDLGVQRHPVQHVIRDWTADSFEAGTIGSAWEVVGAAPGWVSGVEALTSLNSLVYRLDTHNDPNQCGGFLRHSYASSTTRIGARMRFALPSVANTLRAGYQLELLGGDTPQGDPAFGVTFEYDKSGYSLRLWAVDRHGDVFEAARAPVPGGAGTVAVDWRAGAGDKAPTGTVRLWLDGTRVAEIVGLDSYGMELSAMRLGALCLGGGVSTSVRVDDLEVWKSRLR